MDNKLNNDVFKIYDWCSLIYVNIFDSGFKWVIICVIEWLIGKIIIICCICVFECCGVLMGWVFWLVMMEVMGIDLLMFDYEF